MPPIPSRAPPAVRTPPCSAMARAAAFPSQKGSSVTTAKRQKQLSRTAIERNVNADCPPFIWQCAGMDDPRNATQFADVLAACGVPFELHIFPYGNHGTALSNELRPRPPRQRPSRSHWTKLCTEWLRLYGF